MSKLLKAFAAIGWIVVIIGCDSAGSPNNRIRPTVEEQARCSTQADKVAKQYEIDSGAVSIDPTNHYNPRTGICAISIYSITPGPGGTQRSDEFLEDAFEHRRFGSFSWSNGKVDVCNVTLPSGEAKTCNSRPEFDRLMDAYMK